MLMIAAISVAGAGLFVWLYIGRNLVARLVGLERTMTRLAGGDLTAEVDARRSGDEIGQMAQALSVFREGIVRANALAAEQAVEQEANRSAPRDRPVDPRASTTARPTRWPRCRPPPRT